jgi:Zn2+/Cd2+-exporting ATPase
MNMKAIPSNTGTPALAWPVLNEVSLGFITTALTLLGLLLGLLGLSLTTPWLIWLGFGINYLAGGIPATRSAIGTLMSERKLDVDLLMVVAALGALSVGAAEDGAILLFLFTLSNTLQSWAMNRTLSAIRALMQLNPTTATVRAADGHEQQVLLADIAVGDLLLLRPGERFAADGVIVEGTSSVDESALTGESVPIDKGVGDGVRSGTLNDSGVLLVQVSARAGESTLAKLIALVEQAQAQKGLTEQFADQFEGRYTLGVLLSLPLVFVAAHFGFGLAIGDAWYRAMTFLVAASPCAVVIATPAAMLSAMAAAARGGVLFKNGAALETLAKVGTLAFDKTGTLTEGKMQLQQVVLLEGGGLNRQLDRVAALQLAASLEHNSEHPLAKAIVAGYRRESQGQSQGELLPLDNPQAIKGKGFVATLAAGQSSQQLWIGNRALAASYSDSTAITALEPLLEALETQGLTTMILGRAASPLALLAVSDQPRSQAKGALARLRQAGLRLVMLTGDRQIVAERVAASLGLDEVRSQLLPEDKLTVMAELRQQGLVAMVGDGINDAPALVAADLGIAMGSGSDVALESADVVLMKSDLDKLSHAIVLAKATQKTVRFNLALALSVIVVVGSLSLFGLVPLPLAVVAHEGGTVLVCLVGLRLLAWRV